MATKNKTAATTADVTAFINTFVDKEQKKQDSFRLVALMQAWTGAPPRMWGPTIIGFGSYHYRYASGHEGDAPLLGFSPRKAEFSLYVTVPGKEDPELLARLGKYRMGKACIYFKKLDDLDLEVLEQISKQSVAYVKATYPASS
ncbi:DUF1801 domain-containing protein [Flaviaesturariibacter amylovorans]|uniref:YdhG-like domain-containing protein n=1 Tax=Flaviaesturariibacter amylovorans TaxID=1084520 RepID=A0ABP8GT44_9BACT